MAWGTAWIARLAAEFCAAGGCALRCAASPCGGAALLLRCCCCCCCRWSLAAHRTLPGLPHPPRTARLPTCLHLLLAGARAGWRRSCALSSLHPRHPHAAAPEDASRLARGGSVGSAALRPSATTLLEKSLPSRAVIRAIRLRKRNSSQSNLTRCCLPQGTIPLVSAPRWQSRPSSSQSFSGPVAQRPAQRPAHIPIGGLQRIGPDAIGCLSALHLSPLPRNQS